MAPEREEEWSASADRMPERLHDPLTRLPNRALFVDRVEHAIARASRTNESLAILIVDLDSFRTVNDSLGRAAGDRLLAGVAERLQGCLRPSDTVARFGGDEFAILLEELRAPGDATRAADRVLESLETPFPVEGREVYVGACIGIAADSGAPAEMLLRNADLAMYQAKTSGRNRHVIFEESMHAAMVERLDLELDLRRAIQRDELVLTYQPVFNLRTGGISGLEALVRWRHPTRGLVAPERFVPLAEKSGAIAALGRWVLRTACHQSALWRARYPAMPDLQVGVNISAAQLHDPALVDEVAEALRIAQLEPRGLTLEVTETAVAEDLATAEDALRDLKDLGVDLALDDFGIGYSSLRHLKRFPLDNLKIDRSFIQGIGREGEELSLLRAILDLSDIFELLAIAEGIERPEQRDRLLELGCERGQGHLLSAPLTADEADALLFKVGLLADDRADPERDESVEAERSELES
jgi:diguanylate cyclase (GGDEF)-like protein